jgi:hypothetical protein
VAPFVSVTRRRNINHDVDHRLACPIAAAGEVQSANVLGLTGKIDRSCISAPKCALENRVRATVYIERANEAAIHISILRDELQAIDAARELRVGTVAVLPAADLNGADRVPSCHGGGGQTARKNGGNSKYALCFHDFSHFIEPRTGRC